MMTTADWAAMASDLAAVRADNAVSVVLRRGAATLAAQSVRLAKLGSGRDAQVGNEAEQSRQWVVVLGAISMDVQPGDRFTSGGVLYEVTAVRPNRRAATMAEAKAVM